MHTKALFISDLHLHPGLPKTTQAFLDFLQNQGKQTEQLYILGDLFEYWAGDDDMDSDFLQTVVRAIRALSDSGISVFWIPGNRDFLTGQGFLEATGAKQLADLAEIEPGSKKIVLAHGDAQCTDDAAYMQFRNMVRNPMWQKQFLGTPLAQRKAIIANMRKNSQATNQEKSAQIMDVNQAVIETIFRQTGASVMIHGHTHQPADHSHEVDGSTRSRMVLSDWNLDAQPVRGDWIALGENGELSRQAVSLK